MRALLAVSLMIAVCGCTRQPTQEDNDAVNAMAADPDYWLRRMCLQPRYWTLDQCVDLKKRDEAAKGADPAS